MGSWQRWGGIVLFIVFVSPSGGAQGTLSGVVRDATDAVLVGVEITATNTATNVATSVTSNSAGSYSIPALPTRANYELAARFPGFREARYDNIELGTNETLRYDFALEVAGVATAVSVIDAADVLATSSASVGEVLVDEQVRLMPLVDANVLNLIKVVPGVYGRLSSAGALDQSFAGISGLSVNTVRDGLIVSSGSLPTGVFSETVINPELVAEMRLVVAPVDAEYGRGNGQVQITTRSGTGEYHGAATWNIRNSALDANTWENNRSIDAETGDWSPIAPDWNNQHQYTLSAGGPVVRDRTFFFALWDQQIHRSRSLIETEVLTEPARNGVFRYMDGWDNGNAEAPTVGTTRAVVDFQGRPLVPTTNVDGTSYTGQGLMCFSVFGEIKADGTPFTSGDCPGGTIVSSLARSGTPHWDPLRPVPDPTGFIARFLDVMPTVNRFTGGDGLNTGLHQWVRGSDLSDGNLSTSFGTNPDSGRKQFNGKLDHRVDGRHALALGFSIERTSGAVNVSNWPGGLSGGTSRRPWVLTTHWTASLGPGFANEVRFGVSRSASEARQPWDSPDEATRARARELWVRNSAGQQAVFYPTGFADEDSPYSGGSVARGSSVLFSLGDALSWFQGVHAFRVGGEVRLTRSNGAGGGVPSVVPVLEGGDGGNPAFAISGFGAGGQPGLLSDNETQAQDLLYFHAASIDSATQAYWVDDGADVDAGVWKSYYSIDSFGYSEELGGYNFQKRIQNELALFAKDDWKVTPALTLNLGMRWEYYGTPYLANGLTTTLADQGHGLFGVARTGREGEDPFRSWLTAGDVYLSGYGPTGTLGCVPGASNGPGLPSSNCDPALLSTPQFVGPGTPAPETGIHRTDLDNWGPAIGFAWRLPWEGGGSMVVRGGYQMTHGGGGRFWARERRAIGGAPGIRMDAETVLGDILPQTPNGYLDLTTLDALLPVTPIVAPGGSLPVTGRSGGFQAYDPNLTTPYVQNFTLALTQQFSPSATLELRYVGTQAKKLLGELELNDVNVFNNFELFEALETTRAGGDALLFDQMFAGVNLANNQTNGGAPYTPVGTTNADGILQTGSMHLRRWQDRNLARGEYESIARTLNTNSGGGRVRGLLPAPFSGVGGRLLRNGCDRMAEGAATIGDVTGEINTLAQVPLRCFPENYLAANPQLENRSVSSRNGIYLTNSGSSSYHALQMQFRLRPTRGTDVRATYSWSKSLEVPTSDYTDPLNRRADLRLTANHHTHDFRLHGAFELPIGPGQMLLGDSAGLWARVIEGWRLGWIFSAFSGSPMTISANDTLYDHGTPDASGPWTARSGEVEWGVIGSGGGESGNVFGPDGPFEQVLDPICQPGSPIDRTDAMGWNLLSDCFLFAIADSRSGEVLLQNARPGKRGTLGQTTFEGPGSWDFDASLAKAFAIDESRRLEVRVDARNVLNHPSPSTPRLSINTFNGFGSIAGKSGSRQFQAQLRLSF